MEYVFYDVDKIKEFVFETFKPKEVAGASELIKCLDCDPNQEKQGTLFKELTGEFGKLEVVYSRGGGGLIITDKDNGSEICDWLEEHYSQYVEGGGSLTAVSQPKKEFITDFSILNYKMRQRKAEKLISQPLKYVRFKDEKNAKCEVCKRREKERMIEVSKNEKIPYCKVCLYKRSVGEVCLHKRSEGKDIIGVESLEEIIKADWDKDNKDMLVIYGDLNEAGKHFSEIKNEEDLKKFSNAVYETLDDTRKKIEKKLDSNGFKSLMPVAGGDDIILFTHPAAFELIKDDLFSVEKNLGEKLTKPVKMNFSFLVAKHNFPIYHLFKMSEELLKKTKDKYYNDPGKRTYHGFFWLLEGGQQLSDDDVYLASDFVTLFDLAKIIHQQSSINRSALYQVLDLISPRSSEMEKQMDMDYFLVRHKELTNLLYREYLSFWITKEGQKLELTKSVLDDIIRMGDLLYDRDKEQEV